MIAKARELWIEERRFMVALVLITVLGAGLRFYGIGVQPPLADDTLSAFTAVNYMEHGQFGPVMPYHPNLRNIMLSATLGIFGNGVIGLKGASLALGTLSVPLLALMALGLGAGRGPALLAAFFIATGPVHVAFSRQAIQEVHTAFFFMLGVWLFTVGFSIRDGAHKPYALVLSGLAFGLGIASKSHALFPLAVCGAVAMYYAVKRRRTHEAALAVASYALVPLSVYMLTFLPWFSRGYDLTQWLAMQKHLYVYMARHAGNPMDLMVDTEPWKWFLKPLMGYACFTTTGRGVPEGGYFLTVSMGNPAVWMAVLPSFAYCAYLANKQRRIEPASSGWLLPLIFAASYLPLAATTRPIWVLSSIAVTPFAFVMVGIAVSALTARLGRKALYAYLALVAAAAIVLYPMSIGRATHYETLRPLTERFNPHTQDILKGQR